MSAVLFACEPVNNPIIPINTTQTTPKVKPYEVPQILPFADIDYQIFTCQHFGNKFALNIDGENIDFSGGYVQGWFLCGEHINFSVEAGGFRFDLKILTDGTVRSVYFKNAKNSKVYQIPRYVENKFMLLKNLEFAKDEFARTEFRGYLYSSENRTDSVLVQGKLDITYFSGGSCNHTEFVKLDNEHYFDVFSIVRTTTYTDVKYSASNYNGDCVVFETLDKKMSELPIGTYNFNKNSTTPKIIFKRYIGEIMPYNRTFYENEWKDYETLGSFTIENHENNRTKGSINLQVVFDDYIVVFENAKFEFVDY
jgi:hypothetical protein